MCAPNKKIFLSETNSSFYLMKLPCLHGVEKSKYIFLFFHKDFVVLLYYYFLSIKNAVIF